METIAPDLLPQTVENFALLRARALAYVQQTSSQTWTDHNVHDPGITIMEAICYGLSDLGFRMNFNMPDLITEADGTFTKNAFYLPEDILPCKAVTVNDFRKLLIDLPTIKNAWISPILNENQFIDLNYEPIFVYEKESRLILEKELNALPILPNQKAEILSKPVFIFGLYAISIEFEPQPMLGHIDSGEGFEGVYTKDHFGDLYYDLGQWSTLINDKKTLKLIADNLSVTKVIINNSTKNKYNNSDGKLDEKVLTEWYFDLDVLVDGTKVFTWAGSLFQPFFTHGKGISGKDLKFILNQNNQLFFKNIFEKIRLLASAYTDIEQVLQANRNFCENYLPQIAAIPTIELHICADIDVDASVDLEQVQAEIFYKIEQYLSPTIPFYTFNELKDKGLAIEEILQGPKLNNGFVLDADLGAHSFQNQTKYQSDIINAIYETPGLINIRNFVWYLVDSNGLKINALNPWTLAITDGFKVVLNKRKTKFTFFKNTLPLLAHFKETILKYNILNINAIKAKTTAIESKVYQRNYRDLAKHFTLADEFPANYTLGKNLPQPFASDPKYYKAKQLEGYLLLFDQTIANFLQDLEALRTNLSWNTIHQIQHLAQDSSWRKDYLTTSSPEPQWQKVVESNLDFLEKRNASLDYLLARFAHDLSQIDQKFYLASDNVGLSFEAYYQSLIDLKTSYLANFIAISSARGQAINLIENKEYRKVQPSGFECRLARLLGVELVINNLRKTISDLNDTASTERGHFHVLEHLHLRIPHLNNGMEQQLQAFGLKPELLSVCTDDDCTACGGHDPYSFTATVAMPAWLPIYADIHYRDFVEELIRREAPATALLRICWVDQTTMLRFETDLQNWWTAHFNLYYSQSNTYENLLIKFIEAQNKLVVTLKSFRSSYFPSTLHGCDDEGEENNSRVFLGQSTLEYPKNIKKIES